MQTDAGKNIHRIQVKTFMTEDVGKGAKVRRHRYSFYLKHGAKSEVYESGLVDFFALIALPLHTIYIVPTEIIAGRTKCSAYPGNPNSSGTCVTSLLSGSIDPDRLQIR